MVQEKDVERLEREIEELKQELEQLRQKYERLVDTYLKVDRLFVEYAYELHQIERANRVPRIQVV